MKFEFFFGVVEDRFDPLSQGRYRVRVMGYHTDQKSKDDLIGIPTDELLWMRCATSTDSASISGVGNSPTNLVEGVWVMGVFKDEFKQDGLILFSIPGSYVQKPNTLRGFCDPTGQYPRYIGNDVNILAGGGQKGDGIHGTAPVSIDGKPLSVYTQDENTSGALAPDDKSFEDAIADDDPDFTIEKMLKGDEGVRNKWYLDSLGYPTIGIGHLIIHENTRNVARIDAILTQQLGHPVQGGVISPEDVTKLFNEDIQKTRADMMRFENIRRVYVKENRSRQMALENMAFQMGAGGLAKFKNTLNAMYEERWRDAYNGMLDSLWARQTPGRANRVAKIILTGNLESYGVKPKPEEPPIPPISGRMKRSIMALSSPVVFADEIDPDDPSVPPPPRTDGLLFEEPPSAYAAEYPYNHVYESESGHIQEFDDTPGKERYNLKHTSGTYIEISGGGRQVNKVMGDDYVIDMANRMINVKGDYQVVVEGNATVYVMGNCTQQVDGNLTQVVKGNVSESVYGNVEQSVKGNVKQTVNGGLESRIDADVTLSVGGDVVSDIEGNLTATVQGNCNQNVEGDMNLNVLGDYTVTVSGSYKSQAAQSLITSQGTTEISGSTVSIN
ncbi:baseplate hub subunit and tail lysozyme [Aeromonas phage CC2]|uniref:Baseplate central spike protein n=1 Tax=Aeromonas phage CC2 TaxID=1204516 RepID=I6X7Y8_9CAUD|nr:baseplate hub subunit and tail lysozyme [Aeromonas phage CC2]AFN39557.1 baseplate hub subunit [Aeromonas phage CC2]